MSTHDFGGPATPTTYERWALVISFGALLVSIAGVLYQYQELQAQEQAVETQRNSLATQNGELEAQLESLRQNSRQFAASGPVLQLTGSVVPRDEATLQFSDQRWSPGQEISAGWIDQVVAKSSTIWVEARVTNVGRAAGPVTRVGLGYQSDPVSYRSATPECEDENTTDGSSDGSTLEDCDLPRPVEAAGDLLLYVPIDLSDATLRCSSYVQDEGLVLFMDWGDKQQVVFPTGVRVPPCTQAE